MLKGTFTLRRWAIQVWSQLTMKPTEANSKGCYHLVTRQILCLDVNMKQGRTQQPPPYTKNLIGKVVQIGTINLYYASYRPLDISKFTFVLISKPISSKRYTKLALQARMTLLRLNVFHKDRNRFNFKKLINMEKKPIYAFVIWSKNYMLWTAFGTWFLREFTSNSLWTTSLNLHYI